jgi:hypothetical protein
MDRDPGRNAAGARQKLFRQMKSFAF